MGPPHVTIVRDLYFAARPGFFSSAAALERAASLPLATSAHVPHRLQQCREFTSPFYLPPLDWEMHLHGPYIVAVTDRVRFILLEGLPPHPLTQDLRGGQAPTFTLPSPPHW